MGYVSKDFIHLGCGLDLLPKGERKRPPKSIRNYIHGIEEAGDVEVRKVDGSKHDFEILKAMWYDPEDPNLPYFLPVGGHMFIAYFEDEPIGVCLVLEVGNHLFLNNLTASVKGKQMHMPDYLIWHIQKEFGETKFKYLDIGVSYRPSLYRFFKKWATRFYPVIFNSPENPVNIRLKPFVSENFQIEYKNKEKKSIEILKEIIDVEVFTFVPSVYWAEKILTKDNIELSYKTFEFPELSGNTPAIIDLTMIFPVQFGAIITNYDVSDEDMWNRHGCLDVFKRRLVMSLIFEQLNEIDKIISQRKYNHDYLAKLFEYEGIEGFAIDKNIPSAFYFENELNDRYHEKLKQFEIEHYYENGKVGLPIHQNMTKAHLDYLYGIFHGVLNLCSEWEHTDKYEGYKGE